MEKKGNLMKEYNYVCAHAYYEKVIKTEKDKTAHVHFVESIPLKHSRFVLYSLISPPPF